MVLVQSLWNIREALDTTILPLSLDCASCRRLLLKPASGPGSRTQERIGDKGVGGSRREGLLLQKKKRLDIPWIHQLIHSISWLITFDAALAGIAKPIPIEPD